MVQIFREFESEIYTLRYLNAYHHLMNRARRGTDYFVDKADYHQFIDLLQETEELFNVNVAAFCLMPTHCHLVPILV